MISSALLNRVDCFETASGCSEQPFATSTHFVPCRVRGYASYLSQCGDDRDPCMSSAEAFLHAHLRNPLLAQSSFGAV